MMGAIVGTGTNLAYYEQVSRVKKLDFRALCGISLSLSLSLSLTVYIVDETMCPRQMIVNMEWAFFGDRMDVLPVNQFDKLVDEHSATPGERTLEKLTSGMYLGELAR